MCILLQFENSPGLSIEEEGCPEEDGLLDQFGTADCAEPFISSLLSFSVYFTRLLKFKSLLFKTDASYTCRGTKRT